MDARSLGERGAIYFLGLVAVTVIGPRCAAMPVSRPHRRRPEEVERMYSPAEVAERLGVGRSTVGRLLQAGEIQPIYRLSHRVVRIPASAVRRYLRSREV
jgi:excisionase family DNA binding protein